MSEGLAPISSLSWRRPEQGALVLREAEVMCPRAGIRDRHDLVIRDGEIAEIAAPGSADVDGAEVVEAEGLLAMPAFVDPHVHLRTPGHEYKEEIETGTRAAAAGGFCAVVAMANTDPIVDTAPDVAALRERADREAVLLRRELDVVRHGCPPVQAVTPGTLTPIRRVVSS